MTIGKKISLLYALPAALVLVVGGVALVNLRLMHGVIGKLANDSLPGTYSIGRLSGVAKDIRGGIRGHITSNTQADKLKADADLAGLEQTLSLEIKQYEKSVSSSRDRDLFASVSAKFDALLRTASRVRPVSLAGKSEAAMRIFRSDTMPAYLQVQKAIEDVYAFKRQDGTGTANLAVSSEHSAERALWLLFAFSTPFCGLLGWYIVRDIHVVLEPMVHQLTDASVEMVGATQHIASSSDSLAHGATEQAVSVQQTSTASAQIHLMTQQNVEKSKQAARLMRESAESAGHARAELERTLGFMKEMDAASGRVAKIIEVIDAMAFQTNILALNAAVEAARAGEAGMGFAVVADEVRNLAHRSAQAAKDTADLVQGSIIKSKQGCQQLEGIFESVRQMSRSADEAKSMVDAVTAASIEQSRGVEQISKAIQHIDQVTQKTAASAEESASVGHDLSSHSEALQDVVESLRVMTGSAKRRPHLN